MLGKNTKKSKLKPWKRGDQDQKSQTDKLDLGSLT